ncbi:MAG: thiosulfate oxidation carrier protein SoxY, partial [Proteobacteria bacterium]|nr:thiosulfate oxidation carrier protein SoxY [Pseudomonadota bacterium]
MNIQRRQVLKSGGGMAVMAVAIVAGLIRPQDALAADWNNAAFSAKTVADTVKAMGGSAAADS